MTVFRSLAVVAGLGCVLLVGALYADGFARASLPADAGSKVIADSIQAKCAITQNLVAGRLPFAEAVARFQAIDARKPPHLQIQLPNLRGETIEECYARCVMIYAQSWLEDEPGSEAAVARLETERREYLAGTPEHHPASASQ